MGFPILVTSLTCHLYIESGPWWCHMAREIYSILFQVMAHCLTAQSHYLRQCWLVISKIQWHFTWGQFHNRYLSHQSPKSSWKSFSKILLKFPRGQWVKGYILTLCHKATSSHNIACLQCVFFSSSGVNFINSSPPGQNGRHFADDIFKWIFVNENFCILNRLSQVCS